MTPTKPLGHYVLVEQVKIQVKSSGGIVMKSNTEVNREKGAGSIVKILAFGPTAYQGFANCKSPANWGVKVGDTVELTGRYDGKKSRLEEYDEQYSSLRYVLDDEIVGVVDEEFVNKYIKSEDV